MTEPGMSTVWGSVSVRVPVAWIPGVLGLETGFDIGDDNSNKSGLFPTQVLPVEAFLMHYIKYLVVSCFLFLIYQ
jgi:hypothetical protein